MPFDCPEIGELIADLDQQPERLARIRRDNVVNSLLRHDWYHRWSEILRTIDLPMAERSALRSGAAASRGRLSSRTKPRVHYSRRQKREDRPMKVVILAGGLGSRLGQETELKPKPMVRIGDQPILWHIMMQYSTAGFQRFRHCAGLQRRSHQKIHARLLRPARRLDRPFCVGRNHASKGRFTRLDGAADRHGHRHGQRGPIAASGALSEQRAVLSHVGRWRFESRSSSSYSTFIALMANWRR